MPKNIAYEIDNLEEYGKFSMWCLNQDIQIMYFPPKNLFFRSTVFIVNFIDKMATASNKTLCKMNNIPIYTPSFFIDDKDEIIVTPATHEKEIVKNCEMELDKYISFLSKNPSTLSNKGTSSFRSKLTFLIGFLSPVE